MIAKRLTTLLDFTCVQHTVPLDPTGGGLVVISAPVGDAAPWRCPNRREDVRTVQKALNRFKPIDGGPATPLVPDGFCGSLTRKAIRHFQVKWNIKFQGKDVRDGIVDVEGPTIERLRKGPGASVTPPEQLERHLPRLLEILTAVRAALLLVRRHHQGRGGLGFGKLAAASFDRHFHANKTASALQHVSKVERIFLDMLVAVGHVPQGVILLADEPPEIAEAAFMFTFMGGYHVRDPDATFNGIHRGSIYLCPKSRTLNRDAFVYCLIHELAHYVAPASPGISHFGYFHKNPVRYRRLSPAQALRNADSYAQYAYDVVGKRDFNISRNSSRRAGPVRTRALERTFSK